MSVGARNARSTSFAERLRARAPLVGTFQKTPHHHVTELIALTELDFVVLDAEHAGFGTEQIDTCVLAARSADLPVLVRIPSNDPNSILTALDMGATGILVPHVASEQDALRASQAAHYGNGTRGFSPSTRAGVYGTRGLTDYIAAADREVAVVLQIEDAAALNSLHAIASTEGIAGLFVGRADLALSLNVPWEDSRIDQATEAIARACVDAQVACGAHLSNLAPLKRFQQWGASFFIVGSDQSAMRSEQRLIADGFRSVSVIDSDDAA